MFRKKQTRFKAYMVFLYSTALFSDILNNIMICFKWRTKVRRFESCLLAIRVTQLDRVFPRLESSLNVHYAVNVECKSQKFAF